MKTPSKSVSTACPTGEWMSWVCFLHLYSQFKIVGRSSYVEIIGFIRVSLQWAMLALVWSDHWSAKVLLLWKSSLTPTSLAWSGWWKRCYLTWSDSRAAILWWWAVSWEYRVWHLSDTSGNCLESGSCLDFFFYHFLTGLLFNDVYSASKFAVEGFCESLAVQAMKFNIKWL